MSMKGGEKDETGRQGSHGHVEVSQSEVLGNLDLMNDAIEGENREHKMGTWAAVKAYPMAFLWAFIMCFTIVSAQKIEVMMLIAVRSWSHSICF